MCLKNFDSSAKKTQKFVAGVVENGDYFVAGVTSAFYKILSILTEGKEHH